MRMLLIPMGLLLALLPLCSFSPGFYIVRRLHWNPLEKLCGSVGLSLILLYLASWAIYCASPRGTGLPVHPLPFAIVSLLCLVAAGLAWKDMVRFFAIASVRRALAGFGFLLLWTGVLLAIIRVYSGAAWFADWAEHFQRTLFFLRHFPADTPIFPGYAIPARPPMANVLAGFFLAQTGDLFEYFQVVFAFLNTLIFLPCLLMMPALGRKAKRRNWLLVLLFACSPLITQNLAYSWTKAATAFYIILGLWFYLAGWRKQDPLRMTAGFVSLAAGMLVHYSAGPWVVILTLHYLFVIWPKRRDRWKELGGIAAACGLLVSTWLVWSLAVYGTQITLASNSSVTLGKEYKGGTGEKIVSNLFDTVVPLVARDPALLNPLNNQRIDGAIRDWFFVFYQVNLIFGMGLVAGPLILYLTYRNFRQSVPPTVVATPRGKRPAPKPSRPRSPQIPERRFWIMLIVASILLGIAVVGERDPVGSAHLTLLSLQALGLTMLAALLPWNRKALVTLVMVGCAVDFSFGVLLHVHIQSLENTATSTVFPGMEFTHGAIQTSTPGPDALAHNPWSNWFTKHQLVLYDRWLEELTRRNGQDPAFQAILPLYRKKMDRARADDLLVWQGWFAQHGGELQYLGDHVAGTSGMGTNIAMGLLIVLLAGLGGLTLRSTR